MREQRRDFIRPDGVAHHDRKRVAVSDLDAGRHGDANASCDFEPRADASGYQRADGFRSSICGADKVTARASIVAMGATLSLACCSNGSTVTASLTPSIVPSPSASASASAGHACPAIAIVGPALLSPMPGATNVPVAPGRIEIASFPITIGIDLVPAGGSPIVLGTETPAPSPASSGSGTPNTYAYPQLATNTLYSVAYTDLSGDGSCPTAIASGGSFSTSP